MFGWPGREALGRSLAETIIPQRFREAHGMGLARLEAGGASSMLGRRIELYALHRDGREFPVELTVSRHVRPDSIHHFSAFVRDITERRRAEELLHAALRDKEVLIREVHHRVKNNLQIVSGLLSLQVSTADPASRAALQESQDRVQAMALIHEMLDRGKDHVSVDFVEYTRLLTEQLYRLRGIDRSRVATVLDVQAIHFGMDVAVPCGLILHELLSNSFKHAFPDGASGAVRVELRLENGRYLLSVSDNGHGMRPESAARRTQALGLQLVERLAGQLGSRLERESVERGTSFAIRFTARG